MQMQMMFVADDAPIEHVYYRLRLKHLIMLWQCMKCYIGIIIELLIWMVRDAINFNSGK